MSVHSRFFTIVAALVCLLFRSIELAAVDSVTESPAVPEALIAAVRERPWDRQAVEAIAEFFDAHDKPRAELVRLQLERGLLDETSGRRVKTLDAEIERLLSEHGVRWKKPAAAAAADVKIEIGLIDEVLLKVATDETIAAIAPIREVCKLEIKSFRLTPAGCAAIAAMPHLDYLLIEEGSLDQPCVDALEKLPPHVKIVTYDEDVSGKLLDAMGIKRLARFEAFTPEQKKSAGERYLRTYEDYESFGRPLKVAGLGQSFIQDHEMRLLSQLTELEEVDIFESDITERGIASLAGLTGLKRLSLYETKVKSIASLKGLVNLRTLELFPGYDVKMGEAGVEVIENFSLLEKLLLYDDESFHDATIGRLGKLTKLKQVDLWVKTKDPACLASLASLTELVDLRLDLPLDDASLRHFAGLKKVRRAELKGDALTDEAIQNCAGWKELRTLFVQESKITRQGAEQLAAKLPNVTIITKHVVVKSPRATTSFRRHRFRPDVSLLVPVDWTGDTREDESARRFDEDGWEGVNGWNPMDVGPASLEVYLETKSKTPSEAIKARIENQGHRDQKMILRENIVPFAGAVDASSCIYQDELGQYLVCAATAEGGVLIFAAEIHAKRFAEFEPMFLAMARSVRISSDPQQHPEEKVEVPATLGETKAR